MICSSCASSNVIKHPSEVSIHFPNLKSVHKPNVLIFPHLLVCLDCGFSSFITAEIELHVLREEHARSVAA